MQTLKATETENSEQTLIKAIANKLQVDEYKGVPVYIMPKDMKIETLQGLVEQQQDRPYKLVDRVELLSAESFIDYYNRFCSEDSVIFVDIENATFRAIFDYHSPSEGPDWKNHRATYKCPPTPEWNSWAKLDNTKMDQEEFALFVEDNIREVIEPEGATLMESIQTLKAKKGVDFKQSTRLDNGQVQFSYQETIDGQAGVNGQLQIPEKIKLAVKPFMSGAPYEMEARFRYRITPQGLTMWYTLIRPHLIKQDAVSDVVDSLKANMAIGTLIEGLAP